MGAVVFDLKSNGTIYRLFLVFFPQIGEFSSWEKFIPGCSGSPVSLSFESPAGLATAPHPRIDAAKIHFPIDRLRILLPPSSMNISSQLP
jgi:hypothetical protein